MEALLVFDREKVKKLRVLVKVTEAKLKNQVISLLENGKSKEAFNLLNTKAEVRAVLGRDAKPKKKPDVILLESLS